MIALAILTGVILGYTIWGQQVYATGGNIRAAAYAGVNTDRVRALSLVFSALCGAFAGVIYIAFFRSFIPTAGQFRELDAIASVIIGGGSIFGGFGTIIGSLAGAAVITLLRGPAVAPGHSRRRLIVRAVAALGERLHRPHPDPRGGRRHLAAPVRCPGEPS